MKVRAWTRAAVAVAVAGGLAAGCADIGSSGRTAAASPAAARCADERFPVYFTPGSAELPAAAREVIRTASNRVSGCRIAAVDVTGVASPDAAGRAADPALTQKRADAVAQALAQAGLPTPSFDVQAAGAPPHAAGVRTPMARRTEVVLHARPAG